MATTAPHPPGLAACLARLGDGDDTAWSELVASGGPLLGAVCARVAGPDAGDDALHDALLAVGRRARRFRGGGDDPERAARAWLTHLATTSALQVLRTRRRAERRDRAVAAAAATSIDDDAHDALERAELHALVRSELARLPAAQREAVALHHLAGEPIATVAAVQGIAAEAAKKRVQRGVARLRERLARAGLAVAPAALVASLAEAADAAAQPAITTAAIACAVTTEPPSLVTVSGGLAMATAACAPLVALLVLVAWHGTAADESAPLPVGDRSPPAPSTASASTASTSLQTPLDREPTAAQRAQLAQEITADFLHNDLAETMRFLEQTTGVTVAIDPSVGRTRPVTARVDSLAIADLLSVLARCQGLTWRWRGDVVWFERPLDPSAAIAPAAGAPAVDAASAAIERKLSRVVMFDFDARPLAEALSFLRQIDELNIVAHPDVPTDRLITLRGTDMTVGDALQSIAALAGARCAVVDHVLLIEPAVARAAPAPPAAASGAAR